MNERDIWKLVIENMQNNNGFSDLTIELWFSRMNMEKLTPDTAYFSTDNNLVKDIVENKYVDFMRKELAEVLGFDVEIVIISCEKESFEQQYTRLINKQESDKILEVSKMLDGTDSVAAEASATADKTSSVGDDDSADALVSPAMPYTFDNFVVGGSNNYAYKMSMSVAKKPAMIANPLFLYGAPGLGKTHLLYAITNEIKKNHPNYNIIYTKGVDFTNELVEAITNGTTILFREKFRNADVFLVDDIQFIADKKSTQEEFFHTYEMLFEAGKQIIVAADRLPKDIKALAERLRSRFEHGIIADIQPPDLELRVAIAKRKAQHLGMQVPNNVLIYLGENIKDNIRQIEGALKKMRAMAYIQGTDVSMEHAKAVVSDILTAKAAAVTPEKVITYVSQKYNIPFEDIVGKRKTDAIASARQIAVFLLRELTDMSHANVGKVFNRDHSTVVSSVNKIKERMNDDPAFEAEIEDMMKDLRSVAEY